MMKRVSAPGAGTRVSASVERYDPEKGEGVLLPTDGSPGILCRQPVLAAVGLDTLLAGASVDCEAVAGEQGSEVSRILAVDFSAASPGAAPVVPAPMEDEAAFIAAVRRIVHLAVETARIVDGLPPALEG